MIADFAGHASGPSRLRSSDDEPGCVGMRRDDVRADYETIRFPGLPGTCGQTDPAGPSPLAADNGDRASGGPPLTAQAGRCASAAVRCGVAAVCASTEPGLSAAALTIPAECGARTASFGGAGVRRSRFSTRMACGEPLRGRRMALRGLRCQHDSGRPEGLRERAGIARRTGLALSATEHPFVRYRTAEAWRWP